MASGRSLLRIFKLAASVSMLSLLLIGCAQDRAVSPPGTGPATSEVVRGPTTVVSTPADGFDGSGATGDLGFTTRHGDEIVVCGRLYRIGAPVVLWVDPGGYDAYRVEKRFGPYEDSSWEATTRAATRDQPSPARYGLRYGRTATTRYSPAELTQIRGGGWDLELLRKQVDQFVIHYDVAGTSLVCFRVLHDQRFLSVHFMLDIDGTIYQTLDVKERAWHATRSNDRSIGIEIANIGAYGANQTAQPLVQWYEKQPDGRAMITIPQRLEGGGVRQPGPFYSRRNDPVVGVVQNATYQQYDLTPQQYDSLIKLSAALCDIFPQIQPDAPRGTDSKVTNFVLSDADWTNYKGLLGHYHVQSNKQDPGPAFEWDYFLPQVQAQLARIRSTRTAIN